MNRSKPEIAYVTSRPVQNEDNRSTTAPSLEELVRSQHPEVRAGATAGRSFDFAGTRFSPLPKVDLPAYRGRLRLFSLPGVPAYPLLVPPGCAMLDEQREAVYAALSARREAGLDHPPEAPPEAILGRQPLPPESDLAPTPRYGTERWAQSADAAALAGKELPTMELKRVVRRFALAASALGWATFVVGLAVFFMVIGWVAGQRSVQATVIAQPVTDPATGSPR